MRCHSLHSSRLILQNLRGSASARHGLLLGQIPSSSLRHNQTPTGAHAQRHTQEKPYVKLLDALTRTPVLQYSKPTDKVTIQCYASQTGLGAALLQNRHQQLVHQGPHGNGNQVSTDRKWSCCVFLPISYKKYWQEHSKGRIRSSSVRSHHAEDLEPKRLW